MIQKLSRTGRMEGRVAKQNWGEIHLRSYCQNAKKKRKIYQVTTVEKKRKLKVQHYLGRQVMGEEEEET